jgi:hypothetical protein
MALPPRDREHEADDHHDGHRRRSDAGPGGLDEGERAVFQRGGWANFDNQSRDDWRRNSHFVNDVGTDAALTRSCTRRAVSVALVPSRAETTLRTHVREETLMPELLVDFITSLDGYGAAARNYELVVNPTVFKAASRAADMA